MNAFRRSFGQGARRFLSGQAPQAPQALTAARAPLISQMATGPLSCQRSFGVLASSRVLRAMATKEAGSAAPAALGAQAAAPQMSPVILAGQTEAKCIANELSMKAAIGQGSNAVAEAKKSALVFEVGLSFVVMHYQTIFMAVMRCVFQAFRPLLILFGFGQIIKAVFFIAGAPIWMSFYSIWLFEVGYGLAQCAISFIFISFFYNNLSFARARPALGYFVRQQREKVLRAARVLGLGA